jgi:hypothetical protein
MSETANDIKETAEYYRQALILGLVGNSEVIKWIDSVIEEEKNPDISLLEASMAGSKGTEEVTHWLEQVPGSFNQPEVMRRLLETMYNTVVGDRASAFRIISLLYEAHLLGELPEGMGQRISHYEYALDLATEGIAGNIDEIIDDFEIYLKQQVVTV